MGRRGDAHEVGGDAVIGRADDVDGGEVGMLVEGAADGLRRDRVVHVERLVHFRLHPHGVGAAHDEPAHRALVGVAGDRDLLAGVDGGHHHDLIAARGPVDQEERVVRPVGLGGELLGLLDGLGGLEEVVEAADLGEVDREDVVAQEVAEGRVHPLALHVARRMKRDDAGVDVVEEHVEVRGPALIHAAGHSIPGGWTLPGAPMGAAVPKTVPPDVLRTRRRGW